MKDDKKLRKLEKNAPKPVIVFSFDGTVMDTEPAILATYREIFDRHGKNDEFTKEMQLAALDDSVSSVMEVCFPEENTKKLVEEYNSWQRNHLIDLIQPMKGIMDLLTWAKKYGYKTAIVSSRERSSIVELLEHCHMHQYFDVIIGSTRDHYNRVETNGILQACRLLDAKSCVFVGDSAGDLMSAKDAGVFTVGYVSNKDKASSIVEERPDFVTSDLWQINKLLKGEALWLAYDIAWPDAEKTAEKKEKKTEKTAEEKKSKKSLKKKGEEK